MGIIMTYFHYPPRDPLDVIRYDSTMIVVVDLIVFYFQGLVSGRGSIPRLAIIPCLVGAIV